MPIEDGIKKYIQTKNHSFVCQDTIAILDAKV